MLTSAVQSARRLWKAPFRLNYMGSVPKGDAWVNSSSPAVLFSNGEVGAWYDPSDYATLFEDSAGTIPITSPREKPVGLMLDKSKGLVLGPELFTDFTSEGAWTDNGNGSWSITNAASTQDLRVDYVGTTNKRYVITVVVAGHSGSQLIIYPLNASPYLAGNGSFTTRENSNAGFFIIRASTGTSATVSNISVRELPGNHAYQSASSTSRPTLSARYNLLTKTEQFDDAVWTKNASTVSANATTAPNGTLTADKIVSTAATTNIGVTQSITALAAPYKQSWSVKADGCRYIQLLWSGGSSTDYANFDLQTGTVTASSGGSASIAAEANGFYRIALTSTLAAGGASAFCWMASSGVVGRGATFTGNGADGFFAWGADLRVTNDALNQPAYQRVNTATDYDTQGFLPYLRFDGSDDWLQTNSIDFSATDKMTVWAGLRKLNDTIGGVVYETATGSGVGAFYAYAGTASTTTGPNWTFGSRGTGNGYVQSPNTYAAPLTNVLTGTGDISGGAVVLRVNGTSVGSQTGSQGTGNYGAYPLYIGRRGGTTFPFNGWLTQLIVRGAATDAATITNAEKFVATKTGVTL